MRRAGKMLGWLTVLVLLLVWGAPGQEPIRSDAPASQTVSADKEHATYVLGPQDVVTIHATNAPDLSEKPFRLDGDGELSLPMVGRIHAGGLTPQQLEVEVTKRLKVYLEEPEVTVSVTEFKSEPVSILGAVGSPGVHQLEGQKTLLEMLALAGGLKPEAGATVTITRRLEYGRVPVLGAVDDPTHQFSTAEINLKAVTESKRPELNVLIRPHDVISVPHSEVVYVIGEVGKVGPLPLTDGRSISVLEAVSTSGGMLRTAAASHAMILRPVPGQPKRTEVPVDLKKILALKSDDIPLLAGDILVVPGSAGKHAVYRALEAAVTIGTFAAVRF